MRKFRETFVIVVVGNSRRLLLQAYSKLNAESDMFPCLIGIDVSETDLVTQLNREQPSRTSTSETVHREKAEVSKKS